MAGRSHDNEKESSLKNNIPFLTVTSGQILSDFLRVYHAYVCGSPTSPTRDIH